MKKHRVLVAVVLLSSLGAPAFAGGQEEQFVRQLAQQAERAAREGTGQSETQEMYDLLGTAVDLDSITARSFNAHWVGMGLLQRQRAIDIMGKWSARIFAQALTGRESLDVTGSSAEGNYSRVESTLSVAGAGSTGTLPVEWLIGRKLGQLVVEDIVVAGRSTVDAQRSLIEQLFVIAPGNADGVLQGLESVGLQ